MRAHYFEVKFFSFHVYTKFCILCIYIIHSHNNCSSPFIFQIEPPRLVTTGTKNAQNNRSRR